MRKDDNMKNAISFTWSCLYPAEMELKTSFPISLELLVFLVFLGKRE